MKQSDVYEHIDSLLLDLTEGIARLPMQDDIAIEDFLGAMLDTVSVWKGELDMLFWVEEDGDGF